MKSERSSRKPGDDLVGKAVGREPDVATIDADRKAETVTVHVDRMVHHRDVMTRDVTTIVEDLHTNVMAEAPADLHTWGMVEDFRKAMLIADRAAATQNVVLQKADTNHAAPVRVKVAASLAKVEDHRLVEVRAVSSLDLRGHEADAHRFPVVDQVVHRLAFVHHLAGDLREWGHPGHNAASHLAVDHRSETVGRDAHQWAHRGLRDEDRGHRG